MRGLGFCIFVFAAAIVLLAPPTRASSAFDQATELEIDAMDLQQKGDLDGAVAKHRQAVQIYPQSKAFKQNLAQALNDCGVAKYQAKDNAAAIALFQEALANVPNFERAKTNLAMVQGDLLNAEGMVLFKKGDFAGAAEKFRQALAAQPGYKNGVVNLDAAEAEIAEKAQDYATAVAKLQHAVSIASTPFLVDKLTKAQASLAAQQAAAEAEKQKQPKSQ